MKTKKRELSVKDLTLAGIIAALYVLLTLPFAHFSFGIVQFRLAEALTVLPILNAAAIPGVFVGCLLANLLNPSSLGIVDILGGSLATLLAAYLSYKLGATWRSPRREVETSYVDISKNSADPPATSSRNAAYEHEYISGNAPEPDINLSGNAPEPDRNLSGNAPEQDRNLSEKPFVPSDKKATKQEFNWRHIIALLPPIIVNALTVGVYLPLLLLEEISFPVILGSIGSIALTQALVVFGLGLPLLLTLQRTGQLRRE
ncbi:MAG TPA: QueT transporter family protein [Clostridiaceae bacterium]|nr:QueT transporter family protein [Clostridiaceae bacterium]